MDAWAQRKARSLWMVGLRPHDLLQNCFGYGLPTSIGLQYGAQHAGIGLDYPFPVGGQAIDSLLVRHPEFWPPSEGYGTGLYRTAEPEQFPEITGLLGSAG